MNTSVRLNIALAILTVGCFAVIFFSGKQIERRDAEIDRLVRNQHELMAASEQQTTLILKQKELSGKYLSERDSLAKLLKIRPKEVVKYVDRVIVEKVTDTVEVESSIINDIKWKLYDGGQCWKWEADAELNDLDLIVNRTDFEYKNKIVDVFWWERHKRFFWWRIGKKQYYHKVIPECGEVTTKSIEIIKR
jgi:hypothetical protein